MHTGKTFGERLKAVVADSPFSQAEVARRVGVIPNTMTSWVQDKTKPSGEDLEILAPLLKVSADWLLFGTEPDADAMAYREMAAIVAKRETGRANPPASNGKTALDSGSALAREAHEEDGDDHGRTTGA